MNKKEYSDRELMDKFLNNTLSPEEKKEFVLRQKDEQFSDALAERIVHQKGRIELKNKLKTISSHQYKAQSTRNNLMRLSIFSSAVAAVLIITLFLFKVDDTSDVFDEYFAPYPNVYATKGTTKDISSKIEEAMLLYEQEEFEEAIVIFKQLKDADVKEYVRLYYGISLLAVNKIEASKQTLHALNSEDPAYSEGQWYLGLAYIKQDSINKAIATLKNSKHLFGSSKRAQIEKVLEKINGIK